MSKAKDAVVEVLNTAGVEVDGNQPWDLQVHDERLYDRLIRETSLGLGEAYMEGWWDAERIDLLTEKLIRVRKQVPNVFSLVLLSLKSRLFNMQSRSRAKEVADVHYNLSNDLYTSFLDPYNQYSCGYFKDTDDLATAQVQKMDLICKKLQLQKGDRVLDIGCGWGGFAKYAAEHYGCEVVGITISEEQVAYAKEFTKGLPVEIRNQDYRDLDDKKFDKVVSVGMIEHVGHKNYRTMLQIIAERLEDDGLFLLHTIGANESYTNPEPWLDKYIFPNGILPSIKHLGQAAEDLFVMEDWHNFGPYYYKTLRAWDENFVKSWPTIKDRYDDPETFFRMFHFYFNWCAGMFKARHTQLWQIVFSKGRRDEVYQSVR